MNSIDLRLRIETLLQEWREQGQPPRWTMELTLQEIHQWRNEHGIAGLFHQSPLMLTATLDDGWGNGLRTIHLCAQLLGLDVKPLGLMLSPESILSACWEEPPDILGLTMLLSDSEPALRHIGENLPAKTRLIAGGPPFKLDPELAARACVHHVSPTVADFLEYILSHKWCH